jgi:hypothetical protein
LQRRKTFDGGNGLAHDVPVQARLAMDAKHYRRRVK